MPARQRCAQIRVNMDAQSYAQVSPPVSVQVSGERAGEHETAHMRTLCPLTLIRASTLLGKYQSQSTLPGSAHTHTRPSPSCPNLLSPQHLAESSSKIAQT